ncbi:MAG: hypothetical protein K9N48_02475 [Verrucomicrobia bacterium]|nr:hypothetical protein [Verrucomicrobiota bacterium]
MNAAEDNEMVFYNYVYRFGIDEKRRVQIPAKWRPSRPNTIFTLILWPRGTVKDACLLVLPPSEWDDLVAKIKAMPYSDPKAEALRRLLGRKSHRVALDKAGRICIPEEMMKAAVLDKEAVLAGLVDRFEIWNPERYEEAYAEDSGLLPEAFKMI